MKRNLLTILFVLTLAAFAAAQSDTPAQSQGQRHADYRGSKGERMNPQARLDRMSEKLNLTDDQKAKILPILQEESTKAQALRSDNSLSQDDKRSKFQALRQETMSQIRPILTPEQQQKLDTMHKEGRRRGDWGSKPQ